MTMLMRTRPLKGMDEMLDRFDRVFGSRFSPQRTEGQDMAAVADWSPSVDIVEADKEFLIKAEIPGIDKKDVKVTTADGMLTIQGERKIESEEKDKKFHRIERAYGSFSRSFSLPENVKEDTIRAEFKDGLLTVHLTKTAQLKPTSREIGID